MCLLEQQQIGVGGYRNFADMSLINHEKKGKTQKSYAWQMDMIFPLFAHCLGFFWVIMSGLIAWYLCNYYKTHSPREKYPSLV